MIKAVIFDMYETLITLWYDNPYMGKEMSMEAGIEESTFREIWDPSERDRSLGIRSFDDVLKEILIANGKYTDKLWKTLVAKRKASKEESFKHLHPDIVPMLKALKEQGIKIGLITNCFLEEEEAIRKSVLLPYFDAVCMSCVERLIKPDPMIFQLCLDRLGVTSDECLYCGDGGSRELETALQVGMKPVQALWYMRDNARQGVHRMPEFAGAEKPMDIVEMIKDRQS